MSESMWYDRDLSFQKVSYPSREVHWSVASIIIPRFANGVLRQCDVGLRMFHHRWVAHSTPLPDVGETADFSTAYVLDDIY